MPNQLVAINKSNVTTTAAAIASSRLVCSGTFMAAADNAADLVIYQTNPPATTSAAIPAGMAFVLKDIDLSTITVKSTTSGQRYTFAGDAGGFGG